MHNTGFRSIGNDDLQICTPGQFQHLVPFSVGIDAAADCGNDPLVVYFDALLASSEIQGVQTFLFVDQIRQSLGNGLYQYNLAVESGLFIGNIKKIIHKGAQEITFAELHDFFGRRFQNIAVITCLFQYIIVQLFHLLILQYGISISNLHQIPHLRQGPQNPSNACQKRDNCP